MKNIITLLLIITMASCKKEAFSPNLTKQVTIQSTSNGARYTIKVALPENYNPENQKYATLYVLDGEENFDNVAKQCQKLSSDVLVVSIGYAYDRSFDYTPTKADHNGGGAEKFMLFIKDELIPKMESDYAADKARASRTILGHSFGGLFVAHAFTKYNSVFGNYLMLSPSLWYDNQILFRMEQDNRSANNKNRQLVFMGIGALEGDGRMQAPFEGFYQRLNHNYTGIKIVKHMVPNRDHVGSKNPNITEALNFYFQNR